MRGNGRRLGSSWLAAAAGKALADWRAEHGTPHTAAGDDWEAWLREHVLPDNAAPFAPHHVEFWEWVWAIRPGVRPTPFLGVWARGGAKSSSAEMAVVALAAARARKYVLYVSGTQDQADDHVANIGDILESSRIAKAYPDLGERAVNKFGSSKGWRRQRLRTASGFTVDALGLDTSARGIKLEDQRPDLMCHEVGTLVHDDGQWTAVEDHPGLLGLRSEDGLTVQAWGVPTTETVTREHRYWVQRIQRGAFVGEPGWMEASAIDEWIGRKDRGAAIGAPIDLAVEPVPPLVVGSSRMRTMTVAGVDLVDVDHFAVPEELSDPEWWWLIGLWWGDGTVSRGGGNQHAVAIAVADTQPEIWDRIVNVLTRWGYSFSERRSAGCRHLSFSCKWLHRWGIEEWRRLDDDGRYKPGQKVPPAWVERIAPEHQRALLRGYFDADGYVTMNEVRLTSVSLYGLMAARRILARLGIPATVRPGPNSHQTHAHIFDRVSVVQPKYDLRIRHGADALGFDVPAITRNSRPTRCWIADGFLWSCVRSVVPTDGPRKFAPITTASRTYTTWFGLSHNCFDDVDAEDDAPETIRKKIDKITKKLLPAGSADLAILGIQNLIHVDSIFARLCGVSDKTVDFLANKIVSGPIPAVRNLEYATDDSGRYVITGGEPTWAGQNLATCQAQVDDWGFSAFLTEAQHEVVQRPGGMYSHLDFEALRVRLEDLPNLLHIVAWVDPSVSDTDQSDACGVQCDGLGDDGLIYRLFSWEQRSGPMVALLKAFEIADFWGAEAVGVETDNGGDTWGPTWREVWAKYESQERAKGREPHKPSFRHDKAGKLQLPGGKSQPSKQERSARMLSDYERGRFRHLEGTHTTLERALHRFPLTKPLDLADAAFWSWHDLRTRYGQQNNAAFAEALRLNADEFRHDAWKID